MSEACGLVARVRVHGAHPSRSAFVAVQTDEQGAVQLALQAVLRGPYVLLDVHNAADARAGGLACSVREGFDLRRGHNDRQIQLVGQSSSYYCENNKASLGSVLCGSGQHRAAAAARSHCLRRSPAGQIRLFKSGLL